MRGLPRLPKPSKARQAAIDALKEERRRNPRPLSPCVDQKREDIESYYRHVAVGDAAAVRQTQGHLLRYFICDIEGVNLRLGRVYVRNHGAFYMKSGANCFHPKGQTTLVVPTDSVVAWSQANATGQMDVSIFKPASSATDDDIATS